MHCDSQSAKHLIRNLVYHAKTIEELVTNKKLEVQNVDTEVNIVNNLTKSLPDQRFDTLREQMGLQQVDENGAETEGAKGKSKIDTIGWVEVAKSTKSEYRENEDTALSKDTN